MRIFGLILLFVALAVAAPGHHGKHKQKPPEKQVEWHVIPVDKMGCWFPLYSRLRPTNWTHMTEASNEFKKWGEHHKIGGGQIKGFNVGK